MVKHETTSEELSIKLENVKKYIALFGYIDFNRDLKRLNAWLRIIKNQYDKDNVRLSVEEFPDDVQGYMEMFLTGKNDKELESFFESSLKNKNHLIESIVNTIRKKNKNELYVKYYEWFISSFDINADPMTIYSQLQLSVVTKEESQNYSYDLLIGRIVRPTAPNNIDSEVLKELCGVVIGIYYFYNLPDNNGKPFSNRYKENYRKICRDRENCGKQRSLLDSIKGMNIEIEKLKEWVNKLSDRQYSGLIQRISELFIDRLKERIFSIEKTRDNILKTYMFGLHMIAFGEDRAMKYNGSTKLFNVFDISCLPPQIGNINEWSIFKENGIVIPSYDSSDFSLLYNYAISYMNFVVANEKRQAR